MRSGGDITGRQSLGGGIVIGGPVDLLLVGRSHGPSQDWNPRILMGSLLEMTISPDVPDVKNDLTWYVVGFVDVI